MTIHARLNIQKERLQYQGSGLAPEPMIHRYLSVDI